MKSRMVVAVFCLACLILSAAEGQVRQGGAIGQPQIEHNYDRFKDQTAVRLKPRPIRQIARPREELSLSVEAVYKGENPARPKEVSLIFDSVAEHYVYHNEADAVFIVDGKRIDAGTAYMMDALPSPNLIKMTLKLTIPLDTFTKIANGKDVEMKLGTTELHLEEKDLAALRAFASSVGG